jgi:hypothetical protein
VDLELSVLEFDHDPRDDATSALNVRRNRDHEVPLPEWVRGRSTTPGDSQVAYAIAETAGRPVTVRATFTRPAGAPADWEVRVDGGGVLGPIDPQVIAFAGAAPAAAALLPLARRAFPAVGRHDVTWRWFGRPAGEGGPWRPFATTHHRVYLLLAVPGEPWSPAFASARNPWTDVLDVSCALARGSGDPDGATRGIVKGVYSRFRLEYDIENGASRYFVLAFELSRWVERVLRGHRGDAPYLPDCPGERYWADWVVNCLDCAAAVTLMATVLGAPVGCRTQSPFGFVRLIEPIGRGPCNNPFYGCGGDPIVGPRQRRKPFDYHAFAVLGRGTFDACLRVCVPWLVRAALLIAWALLAVVTLGRARRGSLLDDADGWLVGVARDAYQRRVIDPRGPAGSGPRPGDPEVQAVPFM